MYWYVSQAELYSNTPSRHSGVSYSSELAHRQRCANLIQKIAKRLQLPQLCVLTAVVYMHRFFLKHPVLLFPVDVISMATLFLSSKTEDNPRKLKDIVIHGHWSAFKVRHEPNSQQLLEAMDQVVYHENLLLQTLGFEVMVEHPHLHIIRFCKLAEVDKSVAKMAYDMATNSTMVTTICLRFKPSALACFFIYLAARSTGSCHLLYSEIPGDRANIFDFFQDVNPEMLQLMTKEFETSLDDSESATVAHTSETLGSSRLTPPLEFEKLNLQQQVSPDFVNCNPRKRGIDCSFDDCWSTDSSESRRGNQKRPREDCDLSSNKNCNNNRLPGLL